jgi:hypothetical protein
LKLIIEKGLDNEKAIITPSENITISLNFPFQKITNKNIGKEINAVIFVPVAKPKNTDERIKENMDAFKLFEYKYLTRKNRDIVNSEVKKISWFRYLE